MSINLVLHYKAGTSDKIYMVCLRSNSNDDTYSVIAKWGRNGKSFQDQLKGTYKDCDQAERRMIALMEEKLAKGYQDITSKTYNGSVTFNTPCVKVNLESAAGKTLVQVFEEEDKKAPVKASVDRFSVTCLNNTGIEDKFDTGVEYLAEHHEEDQNLFYVYDRFGKMGEFLKSRFWVSSTL